MSGTGRDETGESGGNVAGLVDDLLQGGIGAVLDDPQIKSACLSGLKETGCHPPANHVLLFCFKNLASGALTFGGGVLRSKLMDLIQSNPSIAGFLRKLANLKSEAKTQNDLKAALIAELRARGAEAPDEQSIMADMQMSLEVVTALHTKQKLEGLEAQFAGLVDEVRHALEETLRHMTEPQLLVAGKNWEREKKDQSVAERMNYASGLYGFHGREQDLDLLHRFLGDATMQGPQYLFRWLLLTGPGGEGKSRLALEFCKNHLPPGWRAGKLELDQLESMVDGQFNWRPRQPTLFVIDYPAQAPENVHKLLRKLDRECSDYALPVRVLLLEREAAGEWFTKLLPEGSDTDNLYDHVYADQRQGISLMPIMPEGLVALMQERFTLAGQEAPAEEKLIEAAYKIDPRDIETEKGVIQIPRPLFAAAVAEIMAEEISAGSVDAEELIAGLDREAVLARLINRDREKRWRPAASQDEDKLVPHETLLALATMCLGLSRAELSAVMEVPAAAALLPATPSSSLLSAMGSRDPVAAIDNVEPDILGEYYALDRLEELAKSEKHRVLIDAAFSVGRDDYGVFLLRCLNDFPQKVAALEAFMPGPESNHAGALLFAKLSIDLASRYGKSGDWARVEGMLRRLDELKSAFPKDREIAHEEAKAAFNITNHAGSADNWARVDEMFGRLEGLRSAFPEDREIALRDAMAAFNILKAAGATDDWVRVDGVLGRLEGLRSAFPKDREIALREAKAAVNITNYAGEVGDWARVDGMLGRLEGLRSAFPEDREIALWNAQAAFNITHHAKTAGDWARVDGMLDRLEGLRSAFPKDREIALREAQAAVNIIKDAGKAGDRTRVLGMRRRIEALVSAFQDDEELVAVCGLGIALIYWHQRRYGQQPVAEATREAASASLLWISLSAQTESQIGVKDCFTVLKDARTRFPDDAEIKEIYYHLTEAGFPWDQVPAIEQISDDPGEGSSVS